MAQLDFKLPDIGEGVSEGEIVEWHVEPGDQVGEDDPMVEVMTDKATVTIGAPKDGVIRELRFDVGATAQVGEVIVVLDTDGVAAASDGPKAAPRATAPEASTAAPSTARASGPAATAVGDIREGLPGSAYFARGGVGGNGAGVSSSRDDAFFVDRPLATPATRKIARDAGVDLRRVRPSGPGGRVLMEDVLLHAPGGPSPTGADARVRIEALSRSPGESQGPLEERRPFVGIRRKIAERMQRAKNTAAHFTFVEECDVSRLKDTRARLQAASEAEGVRLSFLPFIVKAVVAGLRKHPVLNSALDETTNELVYRRYYHIGIAAATDQGLMVPVVRDADRRTLLELAQEIERLGEGARTGSLSPRELTGSTFTITSLGKQGGLFATPVLNFPEVGILGVHQMKRKAVVRDDQIVVGDVMLLSLSFDHRIVDGHVGAAFAYDVISYLEDPDRLLLEMR